MSIALESGGGGGGGSAIRRSGFIHGMTCSSIYDSPESNRLVAGLFSGDRIDGVVRGNDVMDDDSCSSSSIGRNSDVSGGSSDGDDSSEVQSDYKGPLDTMDSLEDVLPFKKGISKFYCGKSKSFTSLADASSSSSIKDIAKAENLYSKKRKCLLAHNLLWDKNKTNPLLRNIGGISKRPANSSRSSLALAMTLSSSSESNSISDNSNSASSSPSRCRPPLHPHPHPHPHQGKKSPNSRSSSPPEAHRKFHQWRSFSMTDLQGADEDVLKKDSRILQ